MSSVQSGSGPALLSDEQIANMIGAPDANGVRIMFYKEDQWIAVHPDVPSHWLVRERDGSWNARPMVTF